MIATATIELIRDLDILQIVEHYTPLKKAGTNRYAGLCPFHTEKTPSFYINTADQYYKCFGCGAGGDGIRFIQEIEHKTFVEAAEILASRFLIPIEYTNEPNRDEKEKLFTEVAEQVARAQKNLTENEVVRQYIFARGISDETTATFQIGANGDRLIQPIFNAAGRAISTATRPVPDGSWKNGPNTLIYEKSKVLFGLHLARPAIREKDYVILVEGYFDCAALHQHGYRNTVALCGTSLSDEQINLIRRYTQNVWLLLDPDEPGQKAMEKITLQLLPLGFHVEILFTGAEVDVDEVLANTPDSLKQIFIS